MRKVVILVILDTHCSLCLLRVSTFCGIVGGLLTIMGGFVDGKGLGTPALPTWILDTRQYK